MKTHFDLGRLAFFRVVVRLFGTERAYRVAADCAETAKRLVSESYPFYKRPFLGIRWFYDTDPVELSESGYLQKLSHMHFVQDLDEIIEEAMSR